jgi:uncharacterized membrane protein YfcA
MSPDLINGIFESIGGFFIALSVIKLYREKVVRGVSAIHVAFFTSWGFWNLYFYPVIDQWFSFWGGLLLVGVNAVWLGQMFYYNQIAKLPTGVGLTISAKGLADREQEPERTPRYRWSDK